MSDGTVPQGYVLAEWAGPSPVRLAREPHRLIGPGDTAVIPAGEAEESDNWRPVTAAPKAPPKAAATTEGEQ